MATLHYERPLDLSERILAAGSAGAAASILVNPLDVVKTRMQAQLMARSRAPGELFSRAGIETRNWVLANGMYTWPARNPHEAPIYIHRPPAARYRSTIDGLLQIGRSEGLKTLYRGIDMSLLVGVPMVCLYLPAYDCLSGYFKNQGYETFSPLIAGSIARAGAVVATSAIELNKTRIQSAQNVTHAGSPAVNYRSIWTSLALHKQQGLLGKVRILWTGVGPTLMKDVPFAGLYWSLLEPFKTALEREMNLRPESPRSHSLFVNGAAGASAGGIAAVSTIPFDVIKTHMQTSQGKSGGMLDAAREIVANQGVTSLFTGWGPRGLRVAIAYLILMTSYEEFKEMCQKQMSLAEKLQGLLSGTNVSEPIDRVKLDDNVA